MIEVPDDKALTGLGRTELIALIRALEKDRNEAETAVTECAKYMCTCCMTAEHTTIEHETIAMQTHKP